MKYQEFTSQFGRHAKYAETGMLWMENHKEVVENQPKRFAKKVLISQIKEEHGIGPILGFILSAILSRIVEEILKYWFGDIYET